MKKRKSIALVLLMIISSLFEYQKSSEVVANNEIKNVVYLSGAFLKEGEFFYQSEMTIQDLIDEVGVDKNANLSCLLLEKKLEDEMSLYLPLYNKKAISLNHASKEELMTLKGIGEKTAQKIIDYRNEQSFSCLEDIMEISGIGEKTFMKLRDSLCL